MLFYEAPHKLLATLRDLRDTFGPDRPIALCRELTKLHEEIRRTTLGEAADWYEANPPKGEFVLVVQGESAPPAGGPRPGAGAGAGWPDLREEGLSLRDAARQAARELGLSRNALYQAALKEPEQQS